MTNPVDESEEIESVAEEEVVGETEVVTEEEIPSDDDIKLKPEKKKVAALKARHDIEDYFEMKKLREELDYMYDEEAEKKNSK
jgi:hypothetical protein